VALTKVAESAGCQRVYRINGVDELPDDLSGVVAVTAGASAPESLVLEVITRLNPRDGVVEAQQVVEDEYFPPPPELRELLRLVGLVLDVALGAPAGSQFDAQSDREFTAAQVLARSVS